MFVSCWTDFTNTQTKDLAKGSSNITSGWRAVGLHDGNLLESKFWKHAISTLGSLRSEPVASGDGVTGALVPAVPVWMKLHNDLTDAQRLIVEHATDGCSYDLRRVVSTICT